MRIRISYQKMLSLRFTSALDMQRIWERSIRRAGYKITYSQGYHPQPKIQLGLPLPLGFISEDEKVDIWLENDIDKELIKTNLELNIPEGLEINQIEKIDPSSKPLVTLIKISEYAVRFWDDNNKLNLNHSISDLLQEKEIIRTKRNNKPYDLRPLILDLHQMEAKDDFNLFMALKSEQNQMGRADEVMFALGFELDAFLIKRMRSY